MSAPETTTETTAAPETDAAAQPAPQRRPWRKQLREAAYGVRRRWRILTGFSSFRGWHYNALRDAWRRSDRTVVLLWLCAVVALTAWWATLQASDLAAAGWVFVAVFVGSWYAYNLVTTVPRDRRRMILRLRAKVTGAIRKPELLQPQRGTVQVGRAQGFHRGVVWERWGAYPQRLYSLYSPALLTDGNANDRASVEAAVYAELEGVDEQSKTYRRYQVTWQPSSNQFTVTQLQPVPDYVQASNETLVYDGGAVIGLTGEGLAAWTFDEHMYIQGITNGGKSTLMRHLAISIIRGGHAPGGLILMDGKQSDDFGAFDGREGVLLVADTPDLWGPAFDMVERIVEERYELARAAGRSHGKIPKPRFDRIVVIMDECQNFVARFGDQWENIARVARAANVWLIAGTQRGDIRTAFPSGATRDQYGALVHVGRAKQAGAEIMFGKGSHLVEMATNLEPKKGRFLAVLNGVVWRGQAPWMPTDNDTQHPWAAALYPPLLSAGAGADALAPVLSIVPPLEDDADSSSTSPADLELDDADVDAILEREERTLDELIEQLEQSDDPDEIDRLSRAVEAITDLIAQAGLSDDVDQDNHQVAAPGPASPNAPEKAKPNPASRVEEDY
jgi:hypothetical protein